MFGIDTTMIRSTAAAAVAADSALTSTAGSALRSFLVARAGTGAQSDSILTGVNPVEYTASNPIRLFIIQAAIIIIMTRLLAIPLARIRQPTVIAEVITGILLGPSVMGHIPGFTRNIFPTASLPNLNLMANVGLVLFLFTVGLEVDLAVIKKNVRASAYVGIAGISLPFGLGAAISVGIYNDLIKTSPTLAANKSQSFGHFLLFSGVAMAITAFPVLARILTETKLLTTKVGSVVLAAGVANDVVGWILLALTVALVNASTGLTALYILLTTVAWALFLFLGIRPVFIWLAKRSGSLENGPTQTMTTITILLVLVSAWMTDIIGVHAIFGAFLVGLMVPHEGGFAVALIEKIEDLVSVLLLPLYFALSGLKTNLGALDDGIIWGYTIGIIAIAFISKFVGCAAAARWACNFSVRESTAVGTLMSCKGLVELIVLNIGLSAGILDTRVFSMFVVMAIVSTVATTPLTLWAYPAHLRQEAEEKPRHAISAGDRTDGSLSDEKDGAGLGSGGKGGAASAFISQRVLVVLDRFDNLPGLMTVVQLLQPFTSTRRASPLPAPVADDDDVDSLSGSRSHSESSGEQAGIITAAAATTPSGGDADEKKQDDIASATPILRSDAPFKAPVKAARSGPPGPAVHVSALRLIELTDRLSAVMKAADALVLESQRALDPLLGVFRTFAALHGLRVKEEKLAIVERDEYARTVQAQADRERAERAALITGPQRERGLVLVPWTLPHVYHSFAYPSSSSSSSGAAGGSSAPVTPSIIPRSNPFEGIFGKSTPGGADSADYANSGSGDIGGGPQQANFVRRLFQSAHTADIGLVLDRPATAAAATELLLPGVNSVNKRILLAFMGGPDDRAALAFVLALCDVNENLQVTVLRLRRAADGDDEEGEQQAGGATGVAGHAGSLPPTVHHGGTGARGDGPGAIPAFTAPAHGGTVQDTVYPAAAGGMSATLQASLEDDVALEAATKHAAFAQRGQIRIVERATPYPLSELLTLTEAAQTGQAQAQAKASDADADWTSRPFSLIIVGRGRRMPTMTHRIELKALLASAASNANANARAAAGVTGAAAEAVARISADRPASRAAALVRAHAVPSSAGAHGIHAGALDSDTCKVIGEPAMALMLARVTAPTLVLAASATTANTTLRA
ncbi:K(+)/H(+) antiporter [Tilletia horrida]|nr:K(+)/H(+) antiporter [Tilletia horrida]